MTGIKIKKRSLIFFIGMLISFHCFSQPDTSGGIQYPTHMLMPTPAPPEEIFYKGSVEGGGGVAVPITNRALRLSLAGVYNLHFSGNYVLAPHIFGGLEFEDTQLGSTEENAAYPTLMSIYNAGIKIGYYTYMQQDFLFCYALSAGPSLIVYGQALQPAPRQQSFFVTPNMLASYRVNDELRIGVDFSVLLLTYRFNPAYVGIAQYLPASYNPNKDNNGVTTCILAGFGLYWAFDEGKR